MKTIPAFFRDKVVLITGATGFLGMPLVAKILTDLPDVKKVYLLIRGRSGPNIKSQTAQERLENEFFSSSVFSKLRQFHGERFDAWVRSKVEAVEGDVAADKLGLSEACYRSLQQEVQIYINSAALVKFDPPLDEAARFNVLAVKAAVEFARGCKDAVFVHVSTAYVCKSQPGHVPEAPHAPYEVFAQEYRQETGVDIPMTLEAEVEAMLLRGKAVREAANQPKRKAEFQKEARGQLTASKGNKQKFDALVDTIRERWIERQLIDEGIKRARDRGWNDTYTYTKALGEQMIAKVRGNLPTAIIRQSIMESSFSEPEPGWLGGALRMADPIIVGFGKGRLPDFPGDPNSILDLIPVDFVVNAILAAAVQIAHKRGFEVYHVASGSINPLTFGDIVRATHDYFAKYPMLDNGKPIPVPVWKYPDEAEFLRKLNRKLRALNTASRLLDAIPSRWARIKKRRIALLQNAIRGLQYYIQIYGPYTRLSFKFETRNTQALFAALSPEDRERFNFDVSRIDWHHYLKEVHIPGIKRHALKLGDESTRRRISDPPASETQTEIQPEDATIIDLVVRQAALLPNKTALQIKRDGKWVTYTYQQLYDLSRKTAFSLWQHGYRKDDRVILFAENQPEWGIAYLAAAQIGVIVVPVDPQTTRDEILALADFTGAKAIFTSETLVEKLKTQPPPAHSVSLLNINQHCQPFDATPEPLATPPSDFPKAQIEPDTTASIIFTMGTTVEPRGAMLSHRGFLSNVHAVAQALPPQETDQFLSVLPLYHALAFSCSFLMSLYGGGTVTYLNTFKPTAILETMRETQTTVLVGVPRLFKLLHDTIDRYVLRCPAMADGMPDTDISNKVQEALGGHVRVLVSGGAALPESLYQAFEAWGLTIYQGYGMTETAPVLSVNPLKKSKCGSVGIAVSGVTLEIENPDENGIGEIVAQSPSVMRGYYQNPTATQQVIRDGKLYTGDLGYFDAEGYLYITGRSKDVIVSGAGKNVYPAEIEALYGTCEKIRELGVVGLKTNGAFGEEVHAVIVPAMASEDNQAEMQTAIRQHIQARAFQLPSYQYINQTHFWSEALPRTEAGEIDRKELRRLLEAKLSQSCCIHRAGAMSDCDGTGDRLNMDSGWEGTIISELARLSRLPVEAMELHSDLHTDLGLDSLARVELLLLLETKLRQPVPDDMIPRMRTIGDVIEVVRSLQSKPTRLEMERDSRLEPTAQEVPEPTSTGRLGHLLRFGLRLVYRNYFSVKSLGKENLPLNQPYLIAANHTSHLDTGAIVTALGSESRRLKVLAARDYFFNTPLKAWFFGKLLKFVPFERKGNLLRFLQDVKVSNELLLQNRCLLIYPEGTRSKTGELQPFKAGVGLLAYETGVPIVPVYIDGAYQALPKGSRWPRRGQIRVVFGQPISNTLGSSTQADIMNHEIQRKLVDEIRLRIEALRDSIAD